MKKKKIINKVVLVVALLFVIFTISPCFNVEYAKLTDTSNVAGGEGMNSIVETVLSATVGPLGTALSAVVLLIVGILALLLASIFGPIMGTWGFPSIDQIVFNNVALFDPNFIDDPSMPNLVSINGLPPIKALIQQVYTTGFVVAGSVFVIGAMIIGIKLAITSIATEKAYYKELVGQWLKSLVLLFAVHILVYAVFYINEQVVKSIYDSVKPNEISFEMNIADLGGAGKVVSVVVSFFNFITHGDTEEPKVGGDGIGGLVALLIAKALIGQDLISAIAVARTFGTNVFSMYYISKKNFRMYSACSTCTVYCGCGFSKKVDLKEGEI